MSEQPVINTRSDLVTAIDYIYRLQAEIDRLKAERRWIPVENAMPEKSVTVLAITDQKTKLFASYVNEWWEIDPAYPAPTCKIITHWMPLPPPPEKE